MKILQKLISFLATHLKISEKKISGIFSNFKAIKLQLKENFGAMGFWKQSPQLQLVQKRIIQTTIEDYFKNYNSINQNSGCAQSCAQMKNTLKVLHWEKEVWK